MRESIKNIVCTIIFFVTIILTFMLLSWSDYQAQQRMDKDREAIVTRRLECYEKYKTEECFRM